MKSQGDIMYNNKTRQLMSAALCVAIGILLPMVFHSIPNAGSIFLPMHIPVLLSGFICSWPFSLAAGLVTPLLSSLLTGMPSAARLPAMVCELAVYGMMSGLLFQVIRTKYLALRIYVTLIGSMAAGRLVAGVINGMIFSSGSYSLQIWLTAMFITALPGIIIQFTMIPALVMAICRAAGTSSLPLRMKDGRNQDVFEEAKKMLKNSQASCVVIRNKEIIHTADGRGVSPIMNLHDNYPGLLRDAFVVDKMIGKAAAVILVLGGTTRVYGEKMSAAGLEYLEEHGVRAEYGRYIDVISNRNRDGLCPLEQSVLEIDEPESALANLRETIYRLTQMRTAR